MVFIEHLQYKMHALSKQLPIAPSQPREAGCYAEELGTLMSLPS